MDKIFVVGVGNRYRRDDGIGLEIIGLLQKENNPHLELFDAGTDGFVLLDQLPLYKKTIIIDAVSMNEAPGVVKMFSPDQAKLRIKNDALSTHGFGLAEVLSLAEELKIETEIKIIGVQPEDISFGEGLSDVVKNQIPYVLDLVKGARSQHTLTE